MTREPLSCVEIAVRSDLKLYHVGPPLSQGPLPSLFYFALSGPDSLCLDPYNQPVQFLAGKPLRIFSLTLPGHENGLPPANALSLWAQDPSFLPHFLSDAEDALHYTLQQRLADSQRIAVAGLSRGGLIASHLAARAPRIRFLLQFAPATRLSLAKEFEGLSVDEFDAALLAPALCDRHVRLYIGNADTRVSTESCFDFAMALTKAALQKRIRSPQIELFITPSIGHMGHGTSPAIFAQGAEWIATCLLPH